MTAAIPHTVTGVFSTPSEAELALQQLQDSGFPKEQLGVMHRDEQAPSDEPGTESGPTLVEGGAAGVVTGGILGGVLATAVAFIPGLGPVLGAGLLASIAGGAASGAVAGGVIAALMHFGVSEENAKAHGQEVEAGNVLVLVQAKDESEREQAIDVLRAAGAKGKGRPLV